jgi:hypothetical protein
VQARKGPVRNSVPFLTSHPARVLEVRLQRRQQFGGERLQTPIVPAACRGVEQVDGLDMRLVLRVDIGLVERGGVLGLEAVEDRRYAASSLRGGAVSLASLIACLNVVPAAMWSSTMRRAHALMVSDLVRAGVDRS